MVSLAAPVSRTHIALRIAAAVLGGYGFAWGLIAATASLLCAAGMAFHDAEFLSTLFGLLAFLVVFLWAFAAQRISQVWITLIAGGVALAAIGSFVQSMLV